MHVDVDTATWTGPARTQITAAPQTRTVMILTSVLVEPATLTGPAHTQMTAAPQTLTVLTLTGCATCLHLTLQITVLSVTMASVLEVSVRRKTKPLNTLTLGCANLGSDSTNCPSTHPNCNGSHECEEPTCPPNAECCEDSECTKCDGTCNPDYTCSYPDDCCTTDSDCDNYDGICNVPAPHTPDNCAYCDNKHCIGGKGMQRKEAS